MSKQNSYSDFYKQIVSPPQTKPIPEREDDMIKNRAGGYGFVVDDKVMLERGLILGTTKPTYYASGKELTRDFIEFAKKMIQSNGVPVVDIILDISTNNRMSKVDSCLWVFAMCFKFGDLQTKRYAESVFNKIVRIGTHLFKFVNNLKTLGVSGRLSQRTVSNWYLQKQKDKLAYQLIKYRQREGWNHKDILRFCHPTTEKEEVQSLFRYVTKGEMCLSLPPQVIAFEQAKSETSESKIIKLIQDYRLTREMIPTNWLKKPKVWNALLQEMPMGAMLRSLGVMSSVGLLEPLSNSVSLVIDRLSEEKRFKRVHPLDVLIAYRIYSRGRGSKGKLSWSTTSSLVSALEDAFYTSFGVLEPSGKNTLLMLDVSGSMTWDENRIPKLDNMTARTASAIMSMVTARTEPNHHFVAFSNGVMPIDINAKDSLSHIVWALQNKIEVDTFVMYTDNESWSGDIHPIQALDNYKQAMGIDSRLICIAMTATNYSVADPKRRDNLDVVGFDTNAPRIIYNFSRGER